MATEIEHKYLVINDEYRNGSTSATYFRQGYLSTDPACTVRVRIAGERAVLTIKGTTQNAARPEFEVALDIDMAQSMLNTFCQSPIIEKTRYIYPYAGHTWEVDCFHGDNQGLVMAEIELTHPDESYDFPPFIGRQVTHLPRYYNACLATHPYSQWSDTEKEE